MKTTDPARPSSQVMTATEEPMLSAPMVRPSHFVPLLLCSDSEPPPISPALDEPVKVSPVASARPVTLSPAQPENANKAKRSGKTRGCLIVVISEMLHFDAGPVLLEVFRHQPAV